MATPRAPDVEDRCRALQEAFRLLMIQPPFRLPEQQALELLGPSTACPLLEVDPDLAPVLTPRGDLGMVALKVLPAGRLLLREVPLASTRCDPEDSSYNMLLLLANTARDFDHLKVVSYGLMPRGAVPRAEHLNAEVQSVFTDIIDGLREMVALVRSTKSEKRTVEALRMAFSDLTEADARDIGTALSCFCRKHSGDQQVEEQADAELLRLTVVFLLNSFGSSQDEIRLCRFCALFNHSCEPCAMPEWESRGEQPRVVGMRLMRAVAAGEEITFTYVPLHQNPTAWPLSRRQAFLSKTFAFSCNCSRCLRERRADEGQLEPDPCCSGPAQSWPPSYHLRWEACRPPACVLLMVIDLSTVWPLVAESLESSVSADVVRLRVAG
ncbi:unnamed protein product, partial [Polarella glacialis]